MSMKMSTLFNIAREEVDTMFLDNSYFKLEEKKMGKLHIIGRVSTVSEWSFPLVVKYRVLYFL